MEEWRYISEHKKEINGQLYAAASLSSGKSYQMPVRNTLDGSSQSRI
jgi:hypothetical protein